MRFDLLKARRPWRFSLAAIVALLCVVSGLPTALAQSPTEGAIREILLPIRTDGPKSLDPVQGSTQYDNQACSQVYDGLLQYKYLVRPLELEPAIVTQMPTIVDNADGTQTWKFELREDVFFQDDACFEGGKGRRVVSSDVFYSWKRLADPLYEFENWWLIDGLIVGFGEYKEEQGARVKDGAKFDYDKPVSGMHIVDDRRFEVVLTKPVQQFRWKLAQFQLSVVPREAVEKYGSKFAERPIGTGAFSVRPGDWQPGVSIVFTRNPTYREELYPAALPSDPELAAADRSVGLHIPAGRKLPIIDRVRCNFYVPDPAMWLDFKSGKLGFVQIPAEYFDEAVNRRTEKLRPAYANAGIRLHPEPLLDFIFRGFNMEDSVVGGYSEKQRKLRQAISLAFDLDEMNESFYNATNTVYDGPIPPGLDGFPKDGEGPVSYRGPDVARAKKLLAEAGYPGGKGLPDLVYYTSRGGNNEEQMQAEIAFCKQIGVRISPRLVDFSELIEAINKRTAMIFGFAWGSDYPDAESNLAMFYSKNKAPGSNAFNYDRPEYDTLYERSRTMPPGPERTAVYEQMRDMVVEDSAFIGSMGRTRFYLINPWLKNFKPSEDFQNWYKYLDLDESKLPPGRRSQSAGNADKKGGE